MNAIHIQTVLIGASTCSALVVCCEMKLKTLAPLPSTSAIATTATEVRTVIQRTRSRALLAIRIAAIIAAGHTLIQVANASSTAATRGLVARNSTATIATGIVMESILPSEMGPSSRRNAIHHQPIARDLVRPPRQPTSAANATRSSTKTSDSQAPA